MTRRGRGAFITAHGRQELLDQTINAIRPQVDTIMVLDNASDPKLEIPRGIGSMYIPDQPPNLAKWWNIGLDFFVHWYGSQGMEYDVALLCDDSIVPEGWFDAVTAAMRQTGATAGSSSPWGHQHAPLVKRSMDSDIMNRMCSWAFIIDGSRVVRADESMHWWWFDTDFDIECRVNGGTVLIGGWPVPNVQPNHYTNLRPELAARTALDRQAFAQKRGYVPW